MRLRKGRREHAVVTDILQMASYPNGGVVWLAKDGEEFLQLFFFSFGFNHQILFH